MATTAAEAPTLADRFRRDGFAFPVEALTSDEAAAALEQCRTHLRAVSSVGGNLARYATFPKVHLLSLWADRIAHHHRILDAVESVLGPDLLVWSSTVFTRGARSGSTLAWHQDALYLGIEGFQQHAVRVWVALTDTSPANGTLRYSRGSHRRGLLPHSYGSGGIEDLVRGEEITVDIDESTAVDVNLRAGQCSLHHLAIAHCSGPNSTDGDRFNFAIDYITPDVASTGGEDSALLVRGRDTRGHFHPERRPRADFDQAALAEFYTATARRQARINETVKALGKRA